MARSNDPFYGHANDAAALRRMAAECDEREAESYARCGTDGFLSQWALTMSAQLYRRQAEIAEAGGKIQAEGLYTADGKRVPARLVTLQHAKFSWSTVTVWELKLSAAVEYGRRYIPSGSNSRVQKRLGLVERSELVPAIACTSDDTPGGLYTRCANAYVTTKRTGCPWGTDATPV